MRATFERLRRKTAEVGPAYAARLALRRLVPGRLFCVRRFELLQLSTSAPPVVSAELPPVRWAREDEESLLSAFGHDRGVLRARFERGDRVCVLTSGDELMSYAWFRRDAYEEAELATRYRFGPDDIWLYDAMVAARLRGRGIYPDFLRSAALLLASEGISRVLIQVDRANRNAARAHRAAGAVPIANFSAVRVFACTRVRDGFAGSVGWLWPGEWHETEVGH